MLQRGSEFQKQLDDKEKNKGKECKKIFEVVYWLAKEELPNRKLSSVLQPKLPHIFFENQINSQW